MAVRTRTRARRLAPAAKIALGSDVAAKLAALGCDPIAIMAQLAMDEALDPKLRAAMAKELAGLQFASPRDDEAAGDAPALGEMIAAAWKSSARKPARKTAIKSGAR